MKRRCETPALLPSFFNDFFYYRVFRRGRARSLSRWRRFSSGVSTIGELSMGALFNPADGVIKKRPDRWRRTSFFELKSDQRRRKWNAPSRRGVSCNHLLGVPSFYFSPFLFFCCCSLSLSLLILFSFVTSLDFLSAPASARTQFHVDVTQPRRLGLERKKMAPTKLSEIEMRKFFFIRARATGRRRILIDSNLFFYLILFFLNALTSWLRSSDLVFFKDWQRWAAKWKEIRFTYFDWVW